MSAGELPPLEYPRCFRMHCRTLPKWSVRTGNRKKGETLTCSRHLNDAVSLTIVGQRHERTHPIATVRRVPREQLLRRAR